MNNSLSTLLFIINPVAGNSNTNFRAEIENFFDSQVHEIHFFDLQKNTEPKEIKQKIKEIGPHAVVAVGGDGTVKLVAECLMDTDIPLGIVPAGSANGMAKELGIEIKTKVALATICRGHTQSIHAIKINDQLGIHLSDIGFNAWLIKKFHAEKKRGWWSYVKAAWKVIWRYPQLQVSIQMNGKEIHRQAAMIVIANATKYGTGVLINPKGSLTDEFFEVVVIRKISATEIFKMKLTHAEFDPAKTEVFQTREVKIKSRKAAHFQVDGEYSGKTTTVLAEIMPRALKVLTPPE
jgi:YegS/Rv2252/BmrU family lipid kinase